MRVQTYILSLAVVLCAGGCSKANEQAVEASGPVGLTGIVTSDAEGPMEGVLVGAKGVGGTVTVTVVSDAQGRYTFPPGRLAPSRYRLNIRAAGYDLTDPGVVDVVADRTTELAVKLEKTRKLSLQLMNAEWLASFPGTLEQKKATVNCTHCHSTEIIARNGHDREGWARVLQKCSLFANGATLVKPFQNPYGPRYAKYAATYVEEGEEARASRDTNEEGIPTISPHAAAQAEYLTSVNLSHDPLGTWSYELKTFPRPKGAETKAIVTEYDLPRFDTEPHDAVVDPDGMVWYQDFSDSFLGRLNPRTGEVKEWPLPALKPFPPFAGGGLDVKLDGEGNPWFALMRQNAIAKFDKKTEKITTWNVPAPHNTLRTRVTMLTTPSAAGMVWFVTVGSSPTSWVHGLDSKTGKITSYHVPAFIYGLEATADGNLFFFSIRDGVIGEVDTKTGKTTLFQPPTAASGPRRGEVAADGRVWFGEFRGGNIGMFDRQSQTFREWPLPVPFADPYDVVADANGDVWTGGMLTDYVFRLNPATGEVTKFLLPTVNVNIRRIDVDRSAKPTVWVGENLQGKIAKVELLP